VELARGAVAISDASLLRRHGGERFGSKSSGRWHPLAIGLNTREDLPALTDRDARVRVAAFAFLDSIREETGILKRDVLAAGFHFEGERVPLLNPQGIFKPRLCDLPLSITSVPVADDGSRPYEDAIGNDGLLRYRYRGNDPNHHDNVRLRKAGLTKTPLIYFHGVVPGRYVADYPVFVVGDDPQTLTFTVSVDERRFAGFGNVPEDSTETEIRRRYVTRQVQQRLHQQEFRERVLEAYRRHCAICRLRKDTLLDAAHILGDRTEEGIPSVPNGIALCSLHHRAFDSYLLTVRPDYTIEIRKDVLEETDGPMLIHGLQGFHNQSIGLPGRDRHRPDRERLAARYEKFRQHS